MLACIVGRAKHHNGSRLSFWSKNGSCAALPLEPGFLLIHVVFHLVRRALGILRYGNKRSWSKHSSPGCALHLSLQGPAACQAPLLLIQTFQRSCPTAAIIKISSRHVAYRLARALQARTDPPAWLERLPFCLIGRSDAYQWVMDLLGQRREDRGEAGSDISQLISAWPVARSMGKCVRRSTLIFWKEVWAYCSWTLGDPNMHSTGMHCIPAVKVYLSLLIRRKPGK